MSAYSALSRGHAHPRPLAALIGQAQTVAVTSRAYHSDTLGPFLAKLVVRSCTLGAALLRRLQALRSPLIRAVRGRGLWLGVKIDRELAGARRMVERIATLGVLFKQTHETAIRFAPPPTIARESIDHGLAVFEQVVREPSPRAC